MKGRETRIIHFWQFLTMATEKILPIALERIPNFILGLITKALWALTMRNTLLFFLTICTTKQR